MAEAVRGVRFGAPAFRVGAGAGVRFGLGQGGAGNPLAVGDLAITDPTYNGATAHFTLPPAAVGGFSINFYAFDGETIADRKSAGSYMPDDLAGGAIAFSDYRMDPETAYVVFVETYDDGVGEAISNMATCTTTELGLAITDLTATDETSDGATLHFTVPSRGDLFEVYNLADDSLVAWFEVPDIVAGTYTIAGLLPSTEYTLYMLVYDPGQVNYVQSNSVTFTTDVDTGYAPFTVKLPDGSYAHFKVKNPSGVYDRFVVKV